MQLYAAAPIEDLEDVTDNIPFSIQSPNLNIRQTGADYVNQALPWISSFKDKADNYVTQGINMIRDIGATSTNYLENGIKSSGQIVGNSIDFLLGTGLYAGQKGSEYFSEGMNAAQQGLYQSLVDLDRILQNAQSYIKYGTASGLESSASMLDKIAEYRKNALDNLAQTTHLSVQKLNDLLDNINKSYQNQALSWARSLNQEESVNVEHSLQPVI